MVSIHVAAGCSLDNRLITFNSAEMSLSVGRIQNSLATASQEYTLALASFNFDFSLFKVTPPPEFEDVGAALTKRRRASAENGPAHKLARKLGHLFESMIPATPNLIKAYGLRASKISNYASSNSKAPQFQGPFKDFAGIDGTTIWAAATSGSSAVAVHLLACMLARVWSPSEATSIWEELVAGRKKELSWDQDSDMFTLKDVVAAELSISKDELSEWDASARSWLRTADDVDLTRKRQKQLMLILGDIYLPVNHRLEVYSSVTQAWQTALTTMNSIVAGEPYSIQAGAVLVSLSAWHLYPDIIVLGKRNQEIKQGDELIPPGGVLTIGLKGINPGTTHDGVHWSLSLTHLRYYGAPVLSSKSISSASHRLSVDQFVMVALGCIIGSWGVSTQRLSDGLKLILSIGKIVETGIDGQKPSSLRSALKNTSWVKVLVAAVQNFDQSIGEEREACRKLLSLGLRQYKFFTGGPTDVFGLRSPKIFHLIAEQEDQVGFIRKIMSRRRVPRDSLVIRIPPQAGQIIPVADEAEEEWKASQYTTVLPPIAKQSMGSGHTRWVATKRNPDVSSMPPDASILERSKDDVHFVDGKDIVAQGSAEHFRWRNPPKFFKDPSERTTIDKADEDPQDRALRIQESKSSKQRQGHSKKSLKEHHHAGLRKPNEKKQRSSDHFEAAEIREKWSRHRDKTERHHDNAERHRDKTERYRPEDRGLVADLDIPETPLALERSISFSFCAGDRKGVALFQRTDRRDPKNEVYYESEIKNLNVSTISELLEAGFIDSSLFVRHLSEYVGMSSNASHTVASLRALASCVSIYQNLPGATISPSVLTAGASLGRAKWVVAAADSIKKSETQTYSPQLHNLLPLSLSRPATFACIIMLESGGFNLDPAELQHVMAVSTENSLYVAAPLLCDPLTDLQTHEVRRVVGNIGRAGVAVLIPPINPSIRKSEVEKWDLVTHAPFDGDLSDCFQSTSLHLHFTGYELPIMTSEHGGRFVEAFFLETVVSVHDSGEWVADLDILTSLESPRLKSVVQQPECKPQAAGHKPSFEIVSIDCWEELLEKPTNGGVVRAHGNWQARLAAAAISVQLGNQTILFRGHGCWACGYKAAQNWMVSQEEVEQDDSVEESSDSEVSYGDDLTLVESPSNPRPIRKGVIFII